jgi:glucose-6-phosphate isomerase
VVLQLQASVAASLSAEARTAGELATTLGKADAVETIYWILEHLAANGRARASDGPDPESRRFSQKG